MFLLIVPAISWTLLARAEETRVRFEDLPRLVAVRSLAAAEQRSVVEGAEARSGRWVRSILPKFWVSGGAEVFRSPPAVGVLGQPFASLDAGWSLYNGGRDRLDDEAARAEAQAERHRLVVLEQAALLQARLAFVRVVASRERVAADGAALEITRRNLKAAERRIRAGLATETDQIDFHLHENQIRADLEKTRAEEKTATSDLAAALALDAASMAVDFTGDLSLDGLPTTFPSSVPAVPDRLASVREGVERERAFGFRADRLDRWWVPSVDVYAAAGLLTFRQKESFFVSDRIEGVTGVRLTIPILSGWEERAEAQSNRALREAARLNRAAVAREAARDFEVAEARMRASDRQVKLAAEARELGKSYLERTLSEYTRGVKNSPDVLGATERYIELERAWVDGKLEFRSALFELWRLQGEQGQEETGT